MGRWYSSSESSETSLVASFDEERNWILTSAALNEYDRFSYGVAFSPSNIYALKISGRFEKNSQRTSFIYVLDLIERKTVRTLELKNYVLYYKYWLNNSEFCIFGKDLKKKRFTHQTYRCDSAPKATTDERSWIRRLIAPQKMNNDEKITELCVAFPMNNGCIREPTGDLSILTVHGHEFFLLKCPDFVICQPYNIYGIGPDLPSIRLYLPSSPILTDYKISYYDGVLVSFENKIYVTLSDEDDLYFDRYLQIDVYGFDLNTRTMLYNIDSQNPTLFYPRQCSNGDYELYSYFGSPRIWQSGATVLLHSEPVFGCFWSLNLLKKTIIQKKFDLDKENIVEEKKLCENHNDAALYRDYLFMMKMTADNILAYKIFWLGNTVPRLQDICAVKLMSVKELNTSLGEKYKKFFEK